MSAAPRSRGCSPKPKAKAIRDPLAVRTTSYAPHRPHAPQHAFLALNCNEALYGGAAGGGKSDALLMAALQYVDVPGYAALIVRKTYADLSEPGAIMDRAKTWLANTDAGWSEQRKIFTFPSGARLSFGYLQHSTDRLRYQSAEFQFVAFDELTQFEQNDYLYLHSRVRKPTVCAKHRQAEAVREGDQLVCAVCGSPAPALSQVPLRMRAGSNPGGPGHHWVRSRFIKREPQQDEEEGPLRGERSFIPAKIDDNPSIDKRSYAKQLQNLDSRTRKQLLDGDWNVREPGACFTEFDWDANTLEGTRPPDSPYTVVRAIDWGMHHMPVLWLEVQPQMVFVFDEWHGQDTKIPLMAEAVNERDAEHQLVTADIDSYVDPAGLGTSYQTGETDIELLRSLGVPVIGEGERFGRETRTNLIKTMLEQRRLWISREHCPYLIECLERAIWDRHGVDGAMKDAYKKDGKWDHHLDALGEALARLFPPEGRAIATETAQDVVGPWSPGFYSESEFG